MRDSPYRASRLSHLVEEILADIVLNIDSLIERLKAGMTKGSPVVIYGLGNVGRVLTKQLSEKGIGQAYILDRNKPCNPYSDVKVYSLEESQDLDKDVDVLITPIRDMECIRNDLKALGYNGRIMSVLELLDRKSLWEEYSLIRDEL